MANQSNPNDTTKILSYIVVAAIAFAGGALFMKLVQSPSGATADAEQASAHAPTGGEAGDSAKIPIGDSPVQGPSDAPVTIVEFSDFQCPFCKKGYSRIEKLKKNYPEKVRVVFKHYPLPFHKNAKPAARAAMAAGEQGEKYFWKMHDKLFENQSQWKNGDVAKIAAGWAKGMGLDVAQFKKDLKNNQSAYDKRIGKEMKMGKKLGVKGTPHFFINGEALSGAQPYDKFKNVVESKLDQAQKLLKGGVKKSNLYDKAVAENFNAPSKGQPDKKKKGKKKQTKVEYVPVDDNDPGEGASAEEALVTFVEFSDFQCPFCDKAVPTIKKLKENYGDKVRFVFKHRPLGFHKKAKPAAKAAIAAQMQGKFWEMHDLLFKNQKKFKSQGKDAFVGFAKKLGLNVQKFKTDMKSQEVKKRLKNDIEVAQNVGAKGTPNFWVNGVNVVGAQPYEKFKSVVEQQIDRAQKLKDEKGLSGEKLYKAVVELNKEKVGSAGGGGDKPTKKPKGSKVDMGNLEIGNSPVKGPKNAPITIYEFSDFQCPYCSKAHGTVKKLLKNYEGKIRLVHKHFPLPFHNNAKPAAKAAIAAQKQDKFWEMYDIMFENQKQLGQQGIYEKWARQIGLNVEKFKKDMKAVPDSEITSDKKMGQKVGVKGTPAFIINGKRLVGAQPYNKFKSVVESQL